MEEICGKINIGKFIALHKFIWYKVILSSFILVERFICKDLPSKTFGLKAFWGICELFKIPEQDQTFLKKHIFHKFEQILQFLNKIEICFANLNIFQQI